SGPDTLLVPGEGFVDVKRSRDLWQEVFKGRDSFVRKNGWVDKPSVGIPALYVQTGFMVYDMLQTIGDQPGAAKALADAKAVAQATRISEFFNFSAVELPPLLPGDSRPAVPVPLPAPPATPPSNPKQ
ncbi:MAG: hypothetical protein JNJ98_00590, partial [Gemmatimonadetes bacterium]|nr:hypothetical protein [Gemmatimonadota bacterium]